MTPQDARKLLGGYATGTLTASEEQALFAAALDDQELFDALAREQALREVLTDPTARGRLLAAIDEPRRSWWRSWRPAAAGLALAGVAAVAVVVGTRKPAPVELVAKVEAPAGVPAPSTPSTPRVDALEMRQEAAPAARAIPEKRRAAKEPPPAAAVSDAATPQERQKVEVARDMVVTGAPPDRAPSGGVIGGIVGGVPQAAPPPPPPPALERAAAAEPREMQAFTVPVLSARTMFLSVEAPGPRVQAVRAQSGAAQALGVRYSIVRREGERAVIRFTANVNGYLSVGGATPVALTAMQPYTAPPVEGDEVKVVYARQPQTEADATTVTATEVAGGETYVVNRAGGAFSFTIALKPR